METRKSIFIGLTVALFTSLVMWTELLLDFIGPKADFSSSSYKSAHTVLFVCIYLALFVGVHLGIKSRLKVESAAGLSKLIMAGLQVSFFTALAGVVFTFLSFEVIYPDYLTHMIEATRDALAKKRVDLYLIAQATEKARFYYSTKSLAGFSFAGNLFVGSIYSLVLAFMHKRFR